MPHATTSTRVDARTPARTVTRTRNATINHAVSNASNRTMTQSTPKHARRTLTHILQGACPSDDPHHHVDTRPCAHTSPSSHTYTQYDKQPGSQRRNASMRTMTQSTQPEQSHVHAIRQAITQCDNQSQRQQHVKTNDGAHAVTRKHFDLPLVHASLSYA